MGARIRTSYHKLNTEVKKAIHQAYPDGIEDKLIIMKDVVKNQFFKGLIFDYNDTTYLIEVNIASHSGADDDDDDDSDFDADPDFEAAEEDMEEDDY